MSKEDGGSAFPSHGSMGELVQSGMSLRDYLAGQAIPLAVATLQDRAAAKQIADSGVSTADFVACLCYQVSDSLLKARAK